jgi:hypothetical protein
MAVPNHPLRKLKGSAEAKELMANVRAHRKGGKPSPSKPTSYREIADKHLPSKGAR